MPHQHQSSYSLMPKRLHIFLTHGQSQQPLDLCCAGQTGVHGIGIAEAPLIVFLPREYDLRIILAYSIIQLVLSSGICHGVTDATLTASPINTPVRLALLARVTPRCGQFATIFTYVLSSSLAPTHRLLTFRLSRYGDSSNAPIRRGAQSAYADAALDFLKYMKV